MKIRRLIRMEPTDSYSYLLQVKFYHNNSSPFYSTNFASTAVFCALNNWSTGYAQDPASIMNFHLG